MCSLNFSLHSHFTVFTIDQTCRLTLWESFPKPVKNRPDIKDMQTSPFRSYFIIVEKFTRLSAWTLIITFRLIFKHCVIKNVAGLFRLNHTRCFFFLINGSSTVPLVSIVLMSILATWPTFDHDYSLYPYIQGRKHNPKTHQIPPQKKKKKNLICAKD